MERTWGIDTYSTVSNKLLLENNVQSTDCICYLQGKIVSLSLPKMID